MTRTKGIGFTCATIFGLSLLLLLPAAEGRARGTTKAKRPSAASHRQTKQAEKLRDACRKQGKSSAACKRYNRTDEEAAAKAKLQAVQGDTKARNKRIKELSARIKKSRRPCTKGDRRAECKELVKLMNQQQRSMGTQLESIGKLAAISKYRAKRALADLRYDCQQAGKGSTACKDFSAAVQKVHQDGMVRPHYQIIRALKKKGKITTTDYNKLKALLDKRDMKGYNTLFKKVVPKGFDFLRDVVGKVSKAVENFARKALNAVVDYAKTKFYELLASVTKNVGFTQDDIKTVLNPSTGKADRAKVRKVALLRLIDYQVRPLVGSLVSALVDYGLEQIETPLEKAVDGVLNTIEFIPFVGPALAIAGRIGWKAGLVALKLFVNGKITDLLTDRLITPLAQKGLEALHKSGGGAREAVNKLFERAYDFFDRWVQLPNTKKN